MAIRPGRMPTKQEVLDFINDSPVPVGKREIAKAFNIKGSMRADLKSLLRELEQDGTIDRGRKRRLAPKGALPEVAVVHVAEISVDGEFLARPVGPHAGIEAEIVVVPGGRSTGLPKLGDRVLARLKRVGDKRYEAQPIRVLTSGTGRVLGLVARKGKTTWRVTPTDRRNDREYTITGEPKGIADGDLVLIRPLPTRGGDREAELVERVGSLQDPKAFSLIAIHQNGIPVDFPDAVLAQAEG